jgi:hypothetical protein
MLPAHLIEELLKKEQLRRSSDTRQEIRIEPYGEEPIREWHPDDGESDRERGVAIIDFSI